MTVDRGADEGRAGSRTRPLLVVGLDGAEPRERLVDLGHID